MRYIIAAIAVTFSLAGCSTVMEANRPAAVNLHKFSVGEQRFDVLATIGAPIASDKDGANSCDLYKIYTHGTSAVGKGAIVAGEAAADVFTLGLFEVISTSGEAATKSKIHTVIFCYSTENRLLYAKDNGNFVPNLVPSGPENSSAATAPPLKDSPVTLATQPSTTVAPAAKAGSPASTSKP